MTVPRCGTDEPEHGGPVTNPEVIPDPGPSEHSRIERVKNRETRAVRALATMVTKARVLEVHPGLTGLARRDMQQMMKGQVLQVGYDQRAARYGAVPEAADGCRPCGSGPENTNDPKYALVTWWPMNKPLWWRDEWVPAGFWQTWGLASPTT